MPQHGLLVQNLTIVWAPLSRYFIIQNEERTHWTRKDNGRERRMKMQQKNIFSADTSKMVINF
jgi:hypothetical protein